MKKTSVQIPGVLAGLLLAGTVQAEVFIGPTSSSNRLTIASGEAIIICSRFGSSLGMQCAWIVGGTTNAFSMKPTTPTTSGQTPALKGPAELVLLDSNSAVSFKRISGEAIQTVVVTQEQPFTLSVPAGKTVKFFHSFYDDGFSGRGHIPGTISNSVSSASGELGGAEFTGPLMISVPDEYQLLSTLIFSYYFTDDMLVLPDTGYIRGPSGSFEIAIEKSANLTNWTTVAVQNTGSDTAAFYRLRITK
jgi:hypothetical protein